MKNTEIFHLSRLLRVPSRFEGDDLSEKIEYHGIDYRKSRLWTTVSVVTKN